MVTLGGGRHLLGIWRAFLGADNVLFLYQVKGLYSLCENASTCIFIMWLVHPITHRFRYFKYVKSYISPPA